MKLPPSPSSRAVFLASLLIVASFAGCASFDASNQESLLAAAGFKERTPQTAKQKELYAAAPSYKVERVAVNGKAFYAYKDEKKGTAFIGGEAEYQRYQQLAVQQRIARQSYEAAQMNQEMATSWYSAYGPYAFGPYGYGPAFRMR